MESFTLGLQRIISGHNGADIMELSTVSTNATNTQSQISANPQSTVMPAQNQDYNSSESIYRPTTESRATTERQQSENQLLTCKPMSYMNYPYMCSESPMPAKKTSQATQESQLPSGAPARSFVTQRPKHPLPASDSRKPQAPAPRPRSIHYFYYFKYSTCRFKKLT
jgi:hypothetical protein